MINLNKIRIITENEIEQRKFYIILKKINRLSHDPENQVLMAIDFEFNTKKIALMQILFEVHINDKIIKKYFIIYPPILNIKIIRYLKEHIMANLNILKIFHGSESLDIPYIINDFFDYFTELEFIINFFKSMIDTRYLCEYLKESNVCKIYDLLINLNIIDKSEKERLELNEQKMGNISEIFIDIHNLTSELILYAVHDVVYLIDAYNVLKDKIIKTNPKDYFLLLDCVRYSFLEKKNISNIGDTLNINNYFYYISNTKINLIKSYELIINDYNRINHLLKINFIKSNINNLLRTIVYIIILNTQEVYQSKNKIIDFNFDKKFKLITNDLEQLEFYHLNEFIKQFYDYVLNKFTI